MHEDEEESLGCNNDTKIRISVFDNSVENYFKAIKTITKLCGEAVTDSHVIQQLSSSITFLRDWKSYYSYEPKTVRFACEMGSSLEKNVLSEVKLPPFSSAAVPKQEELCGGNASSASSNDFVMYVGGSVWALDWCPRVHERSAGDIKCEFVAVGAHPPDSYYHKIGSSLTGRGVVQIWCIINASVDEKETTLTLPKSRRGTQNKDASFDKSSVVKKPKGRPRKKQLEEPLDGEATNQNCIQYKRPRGRPRKNQTDDSLDDEATKEILIQFKRAKGLPRRKESDESLDNIDCNNQQVHALAVQYPEDSSQLLITEEAYENTQEQRIPRNKGKKRKSSAKALSTSNSNPEAAGASRRLKSEAVSAVQYPEGSLQLLAIAEVSENTQKQTLQKHEGKKQKGSVSAFQDPGESSQLLTLEGASENTQELTIQKHKDKKRKSSFKPLSACHSNVETTGQTRTWKSKARAGGDFPVVSCTPSLAQNKDDQSFTMNHQIQDPAILNCGLTTVSVDANSNSSSIPTNVALPRVVLCIAHNGKVAWDVKWRPNYGSNCQCQHRMGYLAVLLGNGSLEVWDVPLPDVTKVIYSSSRREGTDPRFVKLEPVFRGSIAKHGERQSIPLTVEWSTSYPHDYLLAGCHDGVVALWKFSASGTSRDTRPLLCFIADTLPIRAVAWAPFGSDQESSNVILTGGHGSLKFWDIRDPFRPLWELHPAPKFIYSLDWLPDPRCIILSFDDGTMRLLSLVKAAYDAHVNGQPSVGPKQQGVHSILNFSSYAIWSVQVSRKTGMVAYCSADGTVCRFQLTSKAVEKDPSRNRTPHFMIGSLSKDGAAITVNIPSPDTPLSLKKPGSNLGENPKSMRSLLESSLTKRTNEKEKTPASDNNKLSAICHGSDPGTGCDMDETLGAFRRQNKGKSKVTNKKMAGENLSLDCIGEEPVDRSQKGTGKAEAANGVEVIPPKMVAMHRVRWNMNKGSERWLCSGGAAGIVRCQEILLSETDKYLAKKR